jgi:hypothetical protein
MSAAVGTVFLGRAIDTTGSYGALLLQLAGLTFIAAILMALMPRYAPSEEHTGLPEPVVAGRVALRGNTHADTY